MTRQRVSSSDAGTVLQQLGRRCALCFGLHWNEDVKHGQIAHINWDSRDSRPANLTFLCLEHHDQYDTRHSQSKGFTPRELRTYTEMLRRHIRRKRQELRAGPSPQGQSPETPLILDDLKVTSVTSGSILESLENVSARLSGRPLVYLSEVYESMSARLLSCAEREVARGLASRLDQGPTTLLGNAFLLNGKPARVSLSVDPDDPTQLVSTLQDYSKSSMHSVASHNLCDAAVYNQIRCEAPDAYLASLTESVAVAQTLLNEGYNWLQEFCVKEIDAQQDPVVEQLYRLVRSTLSDHDRDQVWLYYLCKDGGVYLFDRDAQRNAIDSARRVSRSLGVAAIETVVTLASYVARAEATSDYNIAIPQNIPYLHNPLASDFPGGLLLPQHALFRGSAHVVHPLVGTEVGHVSGGAVWLTAAYPPSLRQKVAPALERLRPLLRQIPYLQTDMQARMAPKFRHALRYRLGG